MKFLLEAISYEDSKNSAISELFHEIFYEAAQSFVTEDALESEIDFNPLFDNIELTVDDIFEGAIKLGYTIKDLPYVGKSVIRLPWYKLKKDDLIQNGVDDFDIDQEVIDNYNNSARKKHINEAISSEIYDLNIMKFIRGEFTVDDLEILRSDISLGSIYLSDYDNSFGIDAEFIYDFFDGFSEFIYEEAKEDAADQEIEFDDNWDHIIYKYDTLEKLIDYYNLIDYTDFADNPKELLRQYPEAFN